MTANENKIQQRRKEVLETKLANPRMSQRELVKEIGTSKGTLDRDLKALGQDGALDAVPIINAIKDADLELVTLGQSILLDRFRDDEERAKINSRDVSAITKDSQVRYSFLAGKNADKKGGETISQEKADAIKHLLEKL